MVSALRKMGILEGCLRHTVRLRFQKLFYFMPFYDLRHIYANTHAQPSEFNDKLVSYCVEDIRVQRDRNWCQVGKHPISQFTVMQIILHVYVESVAVGVSVATTYRYKRSSS